MSKGALPVIMSIIGPRETHDYRNYNRLVCGTNTSPKNQKRGEKRRSQEYHVLELHPEDRAPDLLLAAADGDVHVVIPQVEVPEPEPSLLLLVPPGSTERDTVCLTCVDRLDRFTVKGRGT